jgi:hypothetical protein
MILFHGWDQEEGKARWTCTDMLGIEWAVQLHLHTHRETSIQQLIRGPTLGSSTSGRSWAWVSLCTHHLSKEVRDFIDECVGAALRLLGRRLQAASERAQQPRPRGGLCAAARLSAPAAPSRSGALLQAARQRSPPRPARPKQASRHACMACKSGLASLPPPLPCLHSVRIKDEAASLDFARRHALGVH